MTTGEERVKLVNCRRCGNQFNKYSRPSGARMVCSEECRVVYTARLRAKTKEDLKIWRNWEAINCLCFGILPILVIAIVIFVIMAIIS
ncbi:MAG: hypothetical protein ACXABG_04230 [Promethearchaeota archaeon]